MIGLWEKPLIEDRGRNSAPISTSGPGWREHHFPRFWYLSWWESRIIGIAIRVWLGQNIQNYGRFPLAVWRSGGLTKRAGRRCLSRWYVPPKKIQEKRQKAGETNLGKKSNSGRDDPETETDANTENIGIGTDADVGGRADSGTGGDADADGRDDAGIGAKKGTQIRIIQQQEQAQIAT